jgi:hypothetical protein
MASTEIRDRRRILRYRHLLLSVGREACGGGTAKARSLREESID